MIGNAILEDMHSEPARTAYTRLHTPLYHRQFELHRAASLPLSEVASESLWGYSAYHHSLREISDTTSATLVFLQGCHFVPAVYAYRHRLTNISAVPTGDPLITIY